MKTEHTPGPWRLEGEIGNEPMICGNVAEGPDDICMIIATPDGDTESANARLIAAAPDLLMAAKEGLAECERSWSWYLSQRGRISREGIYDRMIMIQAAIDKAEKGKEKRK